jgi:hypothetical protein
MTIRDHSHATLLSKADLREFERRLEARFLQLEQTLEQKIGGAQSGLTKWFTGIAAAQAAIIVALVKLLPGLS